MLKIRNYMKYAYNKSKKWGNGENWTNYPHFKIQEKVEGARKDLTK